MRKTRWSVLLASLVAAFRCLAQEDPATGFPPHGSFDAGQFDAVNLQNLNVNFAIPVTVSLGRGMNLAHAIVYDSLVWKKSILGSWTPVTDGGGSPLWGWKRSSVTGSIKYTHTTGTCEEWYAYGFVDPAGTAHAFPIHVYAPGCGQSDSTGYASDGSGYYMDANNPDAPVVWDRGGNKIQYSGTMTDANGNYISKTVNGAVTQWEDTTGRIALKEINGSAYTDYQYLDPDGAYQTLRVWFDTFDVLTAFGCSGIYEFGGTATLPVQIDLPTGRHYSFTYESTPGFPGHVTGRLQRVTLPTGGYYEYAYPGANGGVSCEDGTVVRMTRTVNDGTSSSVWEYQRSYSDYWYTKISAPQLPYDPDGNDTKVKFSAGKEIERKIYQGPETGGTLLLTRAIAYSGNGTPSAVTTQLADNHQSKIETDYDDHGNLVALEEYD